MMLEHCVLAQNAIANQEDLVNFGFSRFWKIWASLLAQLVKNPRAVQEFACSAGDPGSIPGWGRSPGDGNDYPPCCSCLGNPMDRGAWQATVHGVASVRHNLVTKPQDLIKDIFRAPSLLCDIIAGRLSVLHLMNLFPCV